MKPALYICIKNPFTERDFERMGIAALSASFSLRILDCTAWLMPSAFLTRHSGGYSHPAVTTIRSLAEFRRALGDGGFALDYVGQFSPQAILMFDALRRAGVALVVVDSGAYPPPDSVVHQRSWARKIVDAVRHGGLRAHLVARINRLLLRCLPDQRPQFALVSGDRWRNEQRFADARCHVPAHSFDYERYRVIRDEVPLPEAGVPGSYAVYLDEDIAGHEDNAEMGLATPATHARFYPALATLFDQFEAASGMRVVIAGYPCRRDAQQDRFAGRQVLVGKTAELIRDAGLVFAHASTAISFAVLWQRPLVFLTSGEIAASWYQAWIEAPAKLLRACGASVDEPLAADWPVWLKIDVAAYAGYRRQFIKADDSPDESLWTILARTLRNDPRCSPTFAS